MFRKKVKEVIKEAPRPKTVYELKVRFIEKKVSGYMYGSELFSYEEKDRLNLGMSFHKETLMKKVNEITKELQAVPENMLKEGSLYLRVILEDSYDWVDTYYFLPDSNTMYSVKRRLEAK